MPELQTEVVNPRSEFVEDEKPPLSTPSSATGSVKSTVSLGAKSGLLRNALHEYKVASQMEEFYQHMLDLKKEIVVTCQKDARLSTEIYPLERLELSVSYSEQRRIQNPFKYLRWSVLQKMKAVNYFRKTLHLRCLTRF